MNQKTVNVTKTFFLLMLLLIGTTMCSQKDVELFHDEELAIRLSEDPDLIKAVQIQYELHLLMLNQEIIMPASDESYRLADALRTMESKEQMKEFLKYQNFKGAEKYADLHMKNVDHLTKAMERFPEFGQMSVEDSSNIIQEALGLAKKKLDTQKMPPGN